MTLIELFWFVIFAFVGGNAAIWGYHRFGWLGGVAGFLVGFFGAWAVLYAMFWVLGFSSRLFIQADLRSHPAGMESAGLSTINSKAWAKVSLAIAASVACSIGKGVGDSWKHCRMFTSAVYDLESVSGMVS